VSFKIHYTDKLKTNIENKSLKLKEQLWFCLNSYYIQWWDSTGSQEPAIGISLTPRTGCWLKSGVLNFFPWTPFAYNLFWQTSHRPVTNF